MHNRYLAVFGDVSGVEVLADLRDFCGMDMDAFADNPERTAYNLGMRRVFLYIQHTMDMSMEEIDAITRKEG